MTNTNSLEVIDLDTLSTITGGAQDGGERTDKYVGCTAKAIGSVWGGRRTFSQGVEDWGNCVMPKSNQPTS